MCVCVKGRETEALEENHFQTPAAVRLNSGGEGGWGK